MRAEYVKFGSSERRYGKKNFYYAQLELLNLISSIRRYKGLRTEEYAMKVLLKSKIGEARSRVEKLESLLPKISEEGLKKSRTEDKIKESLEEEIEGIKRKIEKLHLGI